MLFILMISLIIFSFSDLILNEDENLLIHSPNYPYFCSNNAYSFWAFQVPQRYVIFVDVQHYETEPRWDRYNYMWYGDNADRFPGEMSSWKNLLNQNGIFRSLYSRFASKSASLKLIFSSWTLGAKFRISLSAVAAQGKFKIAMLPFHVIFH